MNSLYLCVSAEFETLCGVLKRLSCPEDKLFLCVKLVLLKSLCLLQSSLDSFSFGQVSGAAEAVRGNFLSDFPVSKTKVFSVVLETFPLIVDA